MKTLKLIETEEKDHTEIREEDIAIDFINGMDEVEVSDTANDNFHVAGSGSFTGKAIYLCGRYDYVLGWDNYGYTILVPLKKKPSCCK